MAYAFAFLILLPALLYYWSKAISISLPVPSIPLEITSIMAFLSIFLIINAMIELYIFGQGLPMNAFPPKKLVTRGVYSVFSHPIYLGVVILCLSASLMFHSSSGLYLVTPVFALATLALILGYENIQLKKTFGKQKEEYKPLFSFPGDSPKTASYWKKLAMAVRVFLPWLLAFGIISFAHCSCYRIPPAALIIFIISFLAILLSITESQLRHYSIVGTVASLLSSYLYIFSWHLRVEWLVFFAVGLAAANYRRIWKWLQRTTEWLANSRHDWIFGNFRIINHCIPCFLAAFVGTLILAIMLGNNLLVIMLTLFALVGAGLFAQLFRGTSKLLRPFSYWGALLGGILAGIVLPRLFGIPFFRIVTALALAAPFMQAIGRIRCLIQGCCHGAVADERIGIRVFNEQSRVCVISGLKGKWIHNTQLYSILSNLMIGPLLIFLWLQNAHLPLLIGLYLMLTGITRFVEEGHRGEAQTKIVLGLRVYQWFAVLSLVAGILISTIHSSEQLKVSGGINIASIGTALVCGLLAAFMMSMDFPKSNIRFSRLSG